MTDSKKIKRTCENGHVFEKSSDCPTCPICENERKPVTGFLSLLSAPARRALESKEIVTVEELAKYSEKEILSLHGIGPSSLPKLRSALQEIGLTFKNN
ncbi:RNA polymerase alpha subunit C-terminal domain-containing protein [Metabacillus halosaccharovorans]|uniref:RNA polymerase alpha subunit C-terminal domain-containing protein n=1 Tax=Metabacillus halosaccharovorans TaxID=930124 RepID=A0ABT3DF24_9BACI|nr:RNA polymerase alpha subunit C-terminal domain-containing protein [Metabacillus halosaccharovorans]MCV9885652.1 RNA polymerase alpha subunit C-terminal domain-containing protein [Metabacillus halosaccharovorans]